MADRLSILIQAILSKTTESEFEAELKKIEQKLKPVKVTATLDDKQLDKFTQKFETLAGEHEKLTQEVREYTDTLGKTHKIIDDIDKETQTVVKTTELITNNYKLQAKELEKIRALEDKQANKEYVNSMMAQIRAIEKRNAEEEKLASSYEKLSAKLKKLQEDARTTSNIIKNFGDKIHHVQADRLTTSLDQLNITQNMTQKEMQETVDKAQQLTNSLKNVSREAKATGNNSMTFAQMLKTAYEKFAVWSVATVSWYSVVNAIKKGIQSITELDTALTELNKVADLTTEQLSRVTDRAYKLGEIVGRTGKEVINGLSEFAKAGYTVEESFNLTQAALIMTNVAEGITSVEEASSSLIAVLKGYKLQVSDAMKVTDMMNEVSNTTATNFDDLADGLRRTSGTLAQTGTDIEELIGLLVGGFEPLRNIEMVSSGLTMISQRLRGIGEDGEAIEGLMPKLQKDFMEIAKISIIDPETGGLRSTYDILSDMAKVFPTLTDQQRQYLSELAAGNRQVKVLNAILENWQSVDKAINSAKNSTGSAMRENEKYLESINGKISQFNSAVQQMWQNTISSDTIKFFVDLGTVLINVVDKIGLLNTALIATVTYFTFFKTSSFIVPLINIVTAGVVKLTAGLNLSTAAAIKLNTALGMIGTVAIVGAIILLVNNLDKLTISMTKYNEKVQESDSKANENISRINTQIERYKELADKVGLSREEKQELLDIERDLKTRYGETTKELDLQNGSLEKNIDLMREMQKEEARRFQLMNERAYKAAEKLLTQPYTVYSQYFTYQYESFEQAIKAMEKQVEEAAKNINIPDFMYNSMVSGLQKMYEEYDAAIEITNKWNHYQNVLNGTLEKTDDDVTNINNSTKKHIPTVEELAKAYEEASDAIDDYQSSAKKLSDIFNTINEDGKISADNILDLIQKYPQLASEIANMNSSKEAGMKLTKQLFELEKANSIIELRNNKAILDSKLSLLEIDEKKYKLAREIAAQNKDGEGVIQATKALMALGNIKELRDQSKSIEEAIGVITGLSIDDFKSKTSGGASSVSKTLTQQQLVDLSKLTQAYIKASLEAYGITKAQEKSLQTQIKQAEKQKDYNKELELTNKLIENQQSQVEQLQTANENIHKRANELRAKVPETDTTKWFTSTGEFTAAYDNLIIEFTNRKNEIIAQMNTLEEKTGLTKAEEQQYKNLQNKLKAIETEQKKTEDLASALQSLKRAYTDNAEAIQTLDDSLTASAQKIVDINKSIYDAQLDELKNQYNLGELTTKQYYEALIKLSKEYSDFLQTNDKDAWNSILLEIKNTSEKITKEYEDLQKDVIGILKKRYDKEEKLRKDQHDILLRQLDDEKKAYQDYINSRIEELDRLYATEDYRNTIGERIQAITDIQSEISKYSLASANGDIEAISKIATLQEQLAEEEKKLAEEQNKRERDLRKQSLQDSLKDFENYIDDKKRVEEDSFNEFKQNIEKATDETALQIEAQKLLMQNSIQDAQSSLLKLFEETGINASETGKILQDEIINRLLQIRDLEKQVKSIAPKKSNLNYGSIPGYTNGGINTTTGLAMLHGTSSRPEWILNTEQMKKLVNGLAFGNIVSKFNIPQISNNKNVAGGINLGGIVINAQKVDENSIPQLVKEVAKVFERKLNLVGIPT